MLVISEKTEIKKDEKDEVYFEYTLSNETYGNIHKKIKWANWDYLSDSHFFTLYEWVTEEIVVGLQEDAIEYNLKQAKLRLNLVRSYLKEKKEFTVNSNSVDELNSILNRVHKNETEEYFNQQNKLKDEMIELSKNEMESKRSITNRVIGLITTVSVGIFTQFFETDISNLEELFSPNFTILIVFFFSLITISFFSFSLLLDINEQIYYYRKLKKIYVEDLNFNSKDFTKKINEPRLWKDYKVYWMILFIAGIISLLGILFFSTIDNTLNNWFPFVISYLIIIIIFVFYLKNVKTK